MKRNWSRIYTDSIKGLTLDVLNRQIEAYSTGRIADFALTCEAMQERDDVLKNVIAKRKKAVARHGWEVLALEDSEEARAHQRALEYFYDHLGCSHVLRQNENGGFALLVSQMMDAVAKGFAVHEIAWQPRVEYSPRSARKETSRGGTECAESKIEDRWEGEARYRNNRQPGAENARHGYLTYNCAAGEERATFGNAGPCGTHLRGRTFLTAHLRFVPLWFFEHTSNQLRLQMNPYAGAASSEALDPAEWLVTTGECVMQACARAYLFKHFPLQAWLDYCLRYGNPGLRAVTTAERDTPEWDAMSESLQEFITNLTVVTNSSESIQLMDMKGSGEPPYIPLVDRMDRVMIALWRGADLSTLSRDNGYGASLQADEGRILEADDAKLISETLNNSIDRQVIKMLFGSTAEPLAYVNVLISPREYTAQDLAIDSFLVQNGVPLSQARTLQRYNRAPAEPGEPLLGLPTMMAAQKNRPTNLSRMKRLYRVQR